MISFPNAKVNLGLNIISKRPDGFHNLETCFIPTQWLDILEIIPSDELKFTSSGIPIPGNPESNLCLTAYHLLQKDFNLPPVHIHLHKIIPIGAGLGGGSSDAAFTLKNLNTQFDLNLSEEKIINYARLIGSDCAFFVKNIPVLASEKGDLFEDISLNLANKHIVIVYPNIHISTGEAFAGVKPKEPKERIKNIVSLPIGQWKDKLENHFESSIFSNHPVIREIKERLYELGADYASMSGSGSSVFGIANKQISTEYFEGKFLVWKGKL